MLYLIFPTVVLIGLCALLSYAIFKADHATKFDCYFVGCMVGFCAIMLTFFWVYELDCTPSAIDVYRGNTELRITSVNGVPTDTVVVFKNK